MQVFLRILRFNLNHKRRLAAAYLFIAGGTAAYVFLPSLFGEAIDQIALMIETGEVSNSAILGTSLLILVLGAVRGVFSFGQTYMGESLGQQVVYDLRNSFYDHVQHLGFGFHDNSKIEVKETDRVLLTVSLDEPTFATNPAGECSKSVLGVILLPGAKVGGTKTQAEPEDERK